MTNQQAAAQAKKRWGKKAYIRNSNAGFSAPEKREAASFIIQNARAEKKRIDEEIARRLAECDWYQELQKQRSERVKQVRENEGNALYYRFNVGKFTGWVNHIIGWGDTWEEAFEMADNKK